MSLSQQQAEQFAEMLKEADNDELALLAALVLKEQVKWFMGEK